MKPFNASILTSAPPSAGGVTATDSILLEREKSPEAKTGGLTLNYFSTAATAARYAASRPRGHGTVLELVAECLEEILPVDCALDVGCGTGHSTVALVPYAKRITGLDSSSEMLAEAQTHASIDYRKGHAEALPFRRESFDLVTASSAYHWFDHERFLHEAARVLRPGGWLVLYKAGTMGRVVEQPAFEQWRQEIFRARYPRVARNHDLLAAATAERAGFTEMLQESTTFRQTHTLASYVENLLTHSSMIRVVDYGHEPIEEARAWLRSELTPFFPGGRAEFVHEARLHVLRRACS